MFRAKLTSKGQITIPVAVRHRLNVQAGDDLLFDISPEGDIKLQALKRQRLTDLYSSLPASRPYPGKARVREEVAGEMGRRILKKEKDL